METLFMCHRCKNKVPRSEIRYSKDGSQIVCKSCYALQPSPSDAPRNPPTANEPKDLELIEDIEDPTKGSDWEAPESAMGTSASKRVTHVHNEPVKPRKTRVTYLCVSCRYKFTLGMKSKVSKRCPFCGKGELLEVTEVSTDELVDEY